MSELGRGGATERIGAKRDFKDDITKTVKQQILRIGECSSYSHVWYMFVECDKGGMVQLGMSRSEFENSLEKSAEQEERNGTNFEGSVLLCVTCRAHLSIMTAYLGSLAEKLPQYADVLNKMKDLQTKKYEAQLSSPSPSFPHHFHQVILGWRCHLPIPCFISQLCIAENDS